MDWNVVAQYLPLFEKAVAAIDTVMTGYGLEKTGEETELKEAGKNGFGYRLKFND